ncbi:MAG: PLP-dependent aminotransferase family protein, partial [Acidobacteria bacterium]|nr:PLP-dependent aminotransferase family protein [Acidobacteriota bacterium]
MNWAALTFAADSPVPIYRQLYEQFVARIESGVLPDGTRLPPTRELAGLLGLNRTTVAAAYQALEEEGLLKAHVGRGSFVRSATRTAAFHWEERFRSTAPDRRLEQALWLGDADSINFSAARLEPDSFSIQDLLHAVETELSAQGGSILQLGAAEGYPPLREWLRAEMREAGIAHPDDEVLVTSGCQQGLDLIAKILTPPDETVLLEDPVYPGARNLFLAGGAQVRGIAVGPSGISIGELEQEFSRHQPRLLVVTPNFQNPTGATLGLEARKEILHLAARFQVAVVENDVYAGLRYRGA